MILIILLEVIRKDRDDNKEVLILLKKMVYSIRSSSRE